MASVFARSCRTLLTRRALFTALPQRSIHSTPAVQKKKGNVDFDDDLFAGDAFEDEVATPSTSKQTLFEPKPVGVSETNGKRRRLSPEQKAYKFNEMVSFMEPRLGKTALLDKGVRKRTWNSALAVANSEADLQRIADLIAKNSEGKKSLLPPDIETYFARRCQELNCPNIAIDVFGNFAKYHLPLTPTAGRYLVNALYQKHPIEKLFVAASLFPAYNLSLADDVTTAAMFATACIKHGTPESLKLAEGLMPKVEAYVKEVNLTEAKSHAEARQKKWLQISLKSIAEAKQDWVAPMFPVESVPEKVLLRA